MAIYPNGTVVELSNGRTGIVIENTQGRPMRPILKILKNNNKEVDSYIYDMNSMETINVTIVGMSKI